MPHDSAYRIDVAVCPDNPRYYRWTVLQDGRSLDLPGFAYASAWSAREAARVALHWHLALKPLRAQAIVDGSRTPVAGEPDRDAA